MAEGVRGRGPGRTRPASGQDVVHGQARRVARREGDVDRQAGLRVTGSAVERVVAVVAHERAVAANAPDLPRHEGAVPVGSAIESSPLVPSMVIIVRSRFAAAGTCGRETGRRDARELLRHRFAAASRARKPEFRRRVAGIARYAFRVRDARATEIPACGRPARPRRRRPDPAVAARLTIRTDLCSFPPPRTENAGRSDCRRSRSGVARLRLAGARGSRLRSPPGRPGRQALHLFRKLFHLFRPSLPAAPGRDRTG